MKTLRKFASLLLLTLILGLPAFADGPPNCSNDPGQTQTPPCTAANGDGGSAETALATSTEATPTTDAGITEVLVDVVENILSIF